MKMKLFVEYFLFFRRVLFRNSVVVALEVLSLVHRFLYKLFAKLNVIPVAIMFACLILHILSFKYLEKGFRVFFVLELPFNISMKFSKFLLFASDWSISSCILWIIDLISGLNFSFLYSFCNLFPPWNSNLSLSCWIFRKCPSILFKWD